MAAASPARFPEREPRAAATRLVPPVIERAVWARDGERCAYIDVRGVRCRETRLLELHHRHAYALGGPPTVANLEIRCRAHDTLAAEHDFGRARIDFLRGVASISGDTAR